MRIFLFQLNSTDGLTRAEYEYSPEDDTIVITTTKIITATHKEESVFRTPFQDAKILLKECNEKIKNIKNE